MASVSDWLAWLVKPAVLNTSAMRGSLKDAFMYPSSSVAHLYRLGHCSILCVDCSDVQPVAARTLR